jgi:hypothetical protein
MSTEATDGLSIQYQGSLMVDSSEGTVVLLRGNPCSPSQKDMEILAEGTVYRQGSQ